MRRTFVSAAVLCTALLAGGASAQTAGGQGTERARQQDDKNKKGETVTVNGCLSVNPEARTYILTTTPRNMAQAAGGAVGTTSATTITYQLVGGQGIEKHVGARLEVTGTIVPDSTITAKSESEQSGPPRNPQQPTEEKPKVETKAEAKIRAQTLRVSDFRFMEGNCKPTK